MRGEEAVWNGKGGERPGQQRGWTWVALRLVGGSSWMAWVDDDGPECGRSWRRARVGPGLQAWATVSFRRPALLGQGSAAQGAALQSMDTSRHLGMPGAWRGGTSVDERAAWTGAGSSLGLLPLTTEALSTAPLLCPGASRPNVSRRNGGAAWSMLGQVGAWQLGRRGWRCPGSSSPNSAGSRTPRARAARQGSRRPGARGFWRCRVLRPPLALPWLVVDCPPRLRTPCPPNTSSKVAGGTGAPRPGCTPWPRFPVALR